MESQLSPQLTEVNKQLEERGLKPLPPIGNPEKGEPELVEVIKYHDYANKFFTDIQFRTTFPGGAQGEYTLRWNANSAVSDGAVMVPMINGQFVLVKQFRPAFGKWMTEFPRGFGETLDKAKINGSLGTLSIADLPLGNAARELGEEVLASAAESNRFIGHLGNVAQDSSTHTAAPSYYFVKLTADDELLAARKKVLSEEGQKLVLWPKEKVESAIGTQINDAHSIVAWTLYQRFVKDLGA